MPPRKVVRTKRPSESAAAAATATAAPAAAAAAATPGRDDSSQSDATFSQFADKDNKDMIGPQGIEDLCTAMGVDPADRRVLFLAWLAGASRMGYFSREEWSRATRRLRAGTPGTVPAALASALAASVDAPRSPEFGPFFEFAFRYCLTEPSQKIVDLDTASAMLSVALPETCHHRGPLLEFLKQQRDYKTLNADQWRGIGRFVREVGPRCADFDDDGAWPLLLDNYVDWVRKGGGGGGGGGK